MAQLVVALDVPTAEAAERLIDELYELDVIFKIGLESLYGYGERIFSYMEARDVRHFVDAKLHDIPRTVGAAVRQLVRHGTHLINVHALGGSEMMRNAVAAARERASELGTSRPNVLAVTVLTSLAESDLLDVGLSGDALENAARLSRLAQEAGCDGVVCSVHEARATKETLGSHFLTLTPGIRPALSSPGDQKRISTPAQAVRAGADYVVVGRPITEAPHPLRAARAVLDELRQ